MRPTSQRGFTFFEILAVITLIVVVAFVSITMTSTRTRMANVAYEFTKDVQTLYNESIRTGRIYRLMFNEAKDGYTLDVFEMPKPKPKADDRVALEKWEKEQNEIQEALKDKERASITRLDRGLFRTVKKRTINSSLKIKSIVNSQDLRGEKKIPQPFLLFYPTGETDQVLIVIEDPSEKIISLEVDPLSGRVKTIHGEVTIDQWKKDLGIK
jgi:hypothetical protein